VPKTSSKTPELAGLPWLALEKVSFQYLSLRHHPVANDSLLRIWGENAPAGPLAPVFLKIGPITDFAELLPA